MVINHARVSYYFPKAYEGTVTRDNEVMPIIKAAMLQDVGPVFERHGIWAVTPKGLECLTHFYFIAKDRVNEQDWEQHMSEKTWVNMEDFARALASARSMVELEII